MEKLILSSERRKKKKATIGLMMMSAGGKLSIEYFDLKLKRMVLSDQYNDDFIPAHNVIEKHLKKRDHKGLVLLHGKAGTGKTSYLRYLTQRVNKDVIYIPPKFALSLSSPEFITMLAGRENSVLIIEDAEHIVTDRKLTRDPAVSNLLNLCDGLLSDCLNIQIICTFNTELSNVDKALLRKGRLIARYEFKPLVKEKAQRLSDALGFNSLISKPMTLAEIYNQHADEYDGMKMPIGFKQFVE